MDRQVFEDLSEKSDFQMDILEKVYRLTELLKEIVKAKLEDELVLKGGTAINFLYFDLPRLSVDIDLDYIGSVRKEKMLEDRGRDGGGYRRLSLGLVGLRFGFFSFCLGMVMVRVFGRVRF